MTHSDFVKRLETLGTLGDLSADQLSVYLDRALNYLAQYQPLHYRLIGVPTQGDDGFYDDVIPADAVDVESVFQSETNVHIAFEVVLDAETEGRRLWLKGVKLPAFIGITTYAGQIQDYVNFHHVEAGQPTHFFGTQAYDKFDVVYTGVPTVENLNPTQQTAIESYVESLGYRYRAGLDDNMSDIVDRGPSGESTTFRNSRKSENYSDLAKSCMDEFNRLVVRPYFSVDSYGEIQKFWSPGEVS